MAEEKQEITDDEITVAEIEDLIKKVEEFYSVRPAQQRINLLWLSQIILKRLYNDLDYYVNVEGHKGFGKSNLILLVALIQCRYSGLWRNKKTGKIVLAYPRLKPLPPDWEHITFGFQFKKNMSFLDNTDEVKKKFFGLARYQPFIIDEGSKNLHKYQWASKLQFLLVKMSDTERYQNKSFYVCFPNFRELNSTFRNYRIDLRLYVFNKNVKQHFSSVILNIKDVNRHVSDPWHTEENAKQFEFLLRNVPSATRAAHHILYAESKLNGYAGYFDVPDLSTIAPRIWKIYMDYKIMNAKKENIEDAVIDEEEDSKRVAAIKESLFNTLSYLRHINPKMTNAVLSDITGIHHQVISRLMNEKKFIRRKDELIKKFDTIQL